MTKTEIKEYIEKRKHWKKGNSWWAKKLGVKLAVIEEVRGMQPYESKNVYTNANDGVEQRIEDAGLEAQYRKFLKSNGIDPSAVTNVWFKQKASGTYFSVETRKKNRELDFDPVSAFKEAVERYDIPEYTISKPKETEQRIGVINLYDAHLDKIACLSETDKEITIEDNIATFEEAFDEILEFMSLKRPEKIIIPLGNDFWHTNDSSLSTKKGTPMADKVHLSDKEAFRLGLDLLRRCIDKARHLADIELFFIKGNHDEDRVAYLLECLRIAYENQPDVTIHDSRKQRQYYRYGSWLFGFAHGDKERKAADLPSRMSTDAEGKKHWSEIDKAVFFLGDIHHEKKYKFMESVDFRGCEVKFLRSMGALDEWHWSHGWTGIPKTGYGFVFDKDGKRVYEHKLNI